MPQALIGKPESVLRQEPLVTACTVQVGCSPSILRLSNLRTLSEMEFEPKQSPCLYLPGLGNIHSRYLEATCILPLGDGAAIDTHKRELAVHGVSSDINKRPLQMLGLIAHSGSAGIAPREVDRVLGMTPSHRNGMLRKVRQHMIATIGRSPAITLKNGKYTLQSKA